MALVAERVAAEPGRPVIGWGHRPGTWTRAVTVSELDDVSGVTPVVLIAGDAHHAWLNSAGLAALGLGARDDVVRENEWFAAYAVLDRLTGDAGTSPAAYRDGAGAGRRRWASSAWSTSSSPTPRRRGSSAGTPGATCCGCGAPPTPTPSRT